ncbi:MAG: DNA repair protein RadC [Ruminococcus sp.]|nr:DNA repair protein RadC [Ruminococcus sp.]
MNTYKTIKEIPAQERPYEKCLVYGPENLSDSELLAVILRSGTTGISSLELARTILHEGDGEQGLLEIHHKSLQELMKIRGIGQVKAVQIKCIGELSKRIASRAAKKELDFQHPETIAEYYMEQLRHEEQEQVICMMLDTKNHFLGDKIISKGTVNSSLVSPRDLLLTAFSYRAVYIILVHNHPSGDATPSEDDMLLTKRVQQACNIVDIPLMDHVIIGDQTYFSFREEGILQ